MLLLTLIKYKQLPMYQVDVSNDSFW